MEITAVDLLKVLLACGVGYSVFMWGMWRALIAFTNNASEGEE